MLFRGKSTVGLEIDHGEVRAVELRGKKGALQLVNLGSIPLPHEAVDKGLIIKPGAVADALRRLWTKANFKSRRTVLGISNQGIVVRFATLPQAPKDKLDEMIRQQAHDYLPIPLNEAVLDYSVIGESKLTGEEQMEVLIVAVQREIIDNYLTVLEQAGLQPLDITIIPLALLQLIPSGSGITVVLNLADSGSNLLLAQDGIPRLARHLSSNLAEAAEQLQCPLRDVVKQAGAAPGEPFPEAFVDWGETLVGEVRASISYYQGQPGAAAVEQLFLSGRGAAIAGFPEQLEEIFGIPVAVVDPFRSNAPLRHKNALRPVEAAAFAVSFSLACYGLED